MPVYEYECLKCGVHFEEIQKFSDAPVQMHDGCGGRVKRLLSAPAIQFKGSGWYVTDYARGNGGSGAKKDAGEATAESKGSGENGASAKTSKKDESKPAAKPANS
jgi:putative FmdB family regulatory protein